MNTDQIKVMQSKLGVEADGFWGPQSSAACKAYLRSLMPMPSPWPGVSQESLTAFYGSAGDESQLGQAKCPPGVCYDGLLVGTIRCNKRVVASLERILKELVEKFPDIARQYNGCYNYRNMRGGSLPSLHARGAAIDFDCDNNGNKSHWPTVATMPLGVMEIFAREGWVPAGAFWSRDAMHFQATLT